MNKLKQITIRLDEEEFNKLNKGIELKKEMLKSCGIELNLSTSLYIRSLILTEYEYLSKHN